MADHATAVRARLVRIEVRIVRRYEHDGEPWVEVVVDGPRSRVICPGSGVLASLVEGELVADDYVGGIFERAFDERLPPEPELARGFWITPELRLAMPYIETDASDTVADLAEYLIAHLDLRNPD
jgi:hypothetical protein